MAGELGRLGGRGGREPITEVGVVRVTQDLVLDFTHRLYTCWCEDVGGGTILGPVARFGGVWCGVGVVRCGVVLCAVVWIWVGAWAWVWALVWMWALGFG